MTFFRHKFRAPHLGKYPMEQVKRVDKPTTRIDADKIKRVPLRAAFFTRPIFGDLGEKVKEEAGYKEKQGKRKEIFFNQVLAHDEIDRLFDHKALTNWKRFDKDSSYK